MRLKSNVHVGSTWYGPAHGNAGDVPDDVAEKITNPEAWEDGKAPAAKTEKERAERLRMEADAERAAAEEAAEATQSDESEPEAPKPRSGRRSS